MRPLVKFLIMLLGNLLLLWSLDSSAQPTRDKVQAVYTSQLGVRELSGKNDGKAVEMYLKSTSLGAGFSWCAAFITWCYLETGVKVIKAAWAPSWFPANRVIYKQNKILSRTPAKGDVLGIWFSNKNRIAHVGFIDQWQEGSKYAVTVEGNTNEAGSREGDGVYRKYRLKSQIYAVSNWIDN